MSPTIELTCETVAVPLSTVTATLVAVSMVVAVIAVTISEAAPVSVPTPVAVTVTDVFASMVLRALAMTEASVTDMFKV